MALSGHLKNYELYQATLHFFLSENDEEARYTLETKVEERLDDLANPHPCQCNPKSTAFRKSIEEGKVTYEGEEINLTDQVKEGLIQFSDEFNLSEQDCLHFWVLASDVKNRRLLEKRLTLPVGSLVDGSMVPTAARGFFFLEKQALLETVVLLMKGRHDTSMLFEDARILFQLSQKLLEKRVVEHTLEIIKNLTDSKETIPPAFQGQYLSLFLQLLADILLHALWET
jgi:hypothetical protein